MEDGLNCFGLLKTSELNAFQTWNCNVAVAFPKSESKMLLIKAWHSVQGPKFSLGSWKKKSLLRGQFLEFLLQILTDNVHTLLLDLVLLTNDLQLRARRAEPAVKIKDNRWKRSEHPRVWTYCLS